VDWRLVECYRSRDAGWSVPSSSSTTWDLRTSVPEGIDVRPHPHIGLATVTYLFDGEIHHRDSLGVSQTIHPGEVNWMTAGSGIVHSERADPSLRSSGGLCTACRPGSPCRRIVRRRIQRFYTTQPKHCRNCRIEGSGRASSPGSAYGRECPENGGINHAALANRSFWLACG
jgi:hypothetical protein